MNFVSRQESGLRPAKSVPLSISSEGTTGHWEGGGIWGGVIGDHSRCASIWRAIQAYHMDHNGWTDIAYNCGVCPHGYVFEGRGPDRRSAANGTNTSNGRSAVACYMGGVGDPFTVEAKTGFLDAGIYLKGDVTWGHRDWYATQCPGDEIYTWIHSSHPMPIPEPTPTPPQGDIVKFTYVQRSNADDPKPVYALLDNGKLYHVSHPSGFGYTTLEDLFIKTLGAELRLDAFPAGYHNVEEIPDGSGQKRKVTIYGSGAADILGIPK